MSFPIISLYWDGISAFSHSCISAESALTRSIELSLPASDHSSKPVSGCDVKLPPESTMLLMISVKIGLATLNGTNMSPSLKMFLRSKCGVPHIAHLSVMFFVACTHNAVFPAPVSPVNITNFEGPPFPTMLSAASLNCASSASLPTNRPLMFVHPLSVCIGSKIGTRLAYPFAFTGGNARNCRPPAFSFMEKSTNIPLLAGLAIKRDARLTDAPKTAYSCRATPPTTPQYASP
mmetsp:Transcript_14240/g.20874  ORF Transcript_14240/g.20874 Transcript_14240/m.20874 type:complete len:234 (-) Transcript_14240:1085-1786(-)